MRTFLRAFLLTALAAPAAAQCTIQFQPKTADERAILAREQTWCDAAIERDAGKLGQVFADDIRALLPDRDLDKTALVEHYLKSIRFLTIESFDVHIRVFGDAAVFTRHTKVHAFDADGKPHDNTHSSVDVFVKRGGDWLCVAT